MLEITDVKVNKVEVKSKLVAFARIVFNDSFCVDGIRVIDGSKGLFIAMPSRKDKNNEYKDVCYPINSETRKMITDKVLENLKTGDEGLFE